MASPIIACASIAVVLGARAAPAPASQATSAAASGTASIVATADERLEAARAMLKDARSARARGDHELARAIAGEAIESLLAGAVGAEHTATLSELGHIAHDSGDLRAAETAWRRVVEVLERTLPDDHPDLQTDGL